jgi:integrase/recombinase XerD
MSYSVKKLGYPPHYELLGCSDAVQKQVQSFFELYVAKGFSVRTIRAYAFDLLVFFRFFQGKKSKLPAIKNLTMKHLVDFIHQEKSRNAAPRSINRRLNTVDIFYRHCFGKLIPGTTVPDLDPTKIRHTRYIQMDSNLGIFPIYAKKGRTFRVRMPHKLIQALEPQEIEAFFETLLSHRDRAIVSLMLICGLRSEEVLRVKISDFNRLAKSLKVHGKGNKERMVPLTDDILGLIEKYMECERPMRPSQSGVEILFLIQKGPSRGRPMTLEGLRSLFRYKRAASGIKNANPHRFRHTFGRNMAQAGLSLPVLQKILGHNDYKTTLTYINLTLQNVHADFESAQAKIKSLYDSKI